MKYTHKKITVSFEKSSQTWIAYTQPNGSCYAESKTSEEDVLRRLCNVLATRLEAIEKAVNTRVDDIEE